MIKKKNVMNALGAVLVTVLSVATVHVVGGYVGLESAVLQRNSVLFPGYLALIATYGVISLAISRQVWVRQKTDELNKEDAGNTNPGQAANEYSAGRIHEWLVQLGLIAAAVSWVWFAVALGAARN